MELLSMVDREVQVEVVYGDLTIEMKAKPGRITPEMLKRHKAVPYSMDNLASMIAEVVTWWDIDEDGENMPVTTENATRIPTLVLQEMWVAVEGASKQEGKA